METTVIQVLEELEANGSRLAKEEILDKNSENGLLRDVLVAALDPYTNYGVRKWKKTKAAKRTDGSFGSFVSWLLPNLASRKFKGNDAKAKVEDHFSRMTEVEQKWAKRILLQNLRCGVQVKTVNKTWPGLIVPFAVQLANSVKAEVTDDNFEIKDEIVYPVWCEPKLDGLRLIAIKYRGDVKLYTRNGTELETLPTLIRSLKACPVNAFVLDGEAMGEDWNESASILMSRKTLKDDSNIHLNVFDLMDYDEWVKQECKRPFDERRIRLTSVFSDKVTKDTPIRIVPGRLVNNEKELRAYYEECLDAGFEGIMLKDTQGLYEFKRTDAMRKLKPVTTYEGVVVGTYEGKRGTKREGIFGGFCVLFPNGIVTNVGSGFSDRLKADIQLEGPSTYIGRIVEVKGQPPLTKDGKVRFPRLVRFRDESDVDPKVIEAYEDWQLDNDTAADQEP